MQSISIKSLQLITTNTTRIDTMVTTDNTQLPCTLQRQVSPSQCHHPKDKEHSGVEKKIGSSIRRDERYQTKKRIALKDDEDDARWE